MVDPVFYSAIMTTLGPIISIKRLSKEEEKTSRVFMDYMPTRVKEVIKSLRDRAFADPFRATIIGLLAVSIFFIIIILMQRTPKKDKKKITPEKLYNQVEQLQTKIKKGEEGLINARKVLICRRDVFTRFQFFLVEAEKCKCNSSSFLSQASILKTYYKDAIAKDLAYVNEMSKFVRDLNRDMTSLKKKCLSI
jgi:hypothetical protein